MYFLYPKNEIDINSQIKTTEYEIKEISKGSENQKICISSINEMFFTDIISKLYKIKTKRRTKNKIIQKR
jgi:hypothetical protein